MTAPEQPTPDHSHDNDSGLGQAASQIRSETTKAVEDIKKGGLPALFRFDKMYFPGLATFLFAAYVIIVAFLGIIGFIAALSSWPEEMGFWGWLYGVGLAIITPIFLIVLGRIWVEIVMVAFKINEGVQDIRASLKDRK